MFVPQMFPKYPSLLTHLCRLIFTEARGLKDYMVTMRIRILGVSSFSRFRPGQQLIKTSLVFLADYLALDLNAVTKKLKRKGVGKADAGSEKYEWMGKPLDQLMAERKVAGKGNRDHFHVDEIDFYHGEFKH
jgi:hypothetical protein